MIPPISSRRPSRITAVITSLLLGAAGCSPYAAWPEPDTVFPYVYTPEQDLPSYAHVRWETEDWDIGDAPSADYLTKVNRMWDGAPDESLAHFDQMRSAIPPLGDGIVLSFVGDILWIENNYESFAIPATELVDADLRIGNLETPTSAQHDVFYGDIPPRFNAPPSFLDNLPFDVLQLNNNHSVDQGDEGLESTKAEVEARGIVPTGVDTQAVVDVQGTEVAIMSYAWGLNERDATSTHNLFIVPFGRIGQTIDLDLIARDLEDAATADLRVVTVHWGFEYEFYPAPHFLQLAREIIALGADVIVGQGPHVVQPPEWCHVNQPDVVPGVGTCSIQTPDGEPRAAAVLYSLGNFSNVGLSQIEKQTGIVAKVSFDGQLTGMGWSPTTMRTEPVITVEPADDYADEEAMAAELERLAAHIGQGWRLPR